MKYLFKVLDVLLFIIVTILFMIGSCFEHGLYLAWEMKKKGGFREDISDYFEGSSESVKNLRGFFETLYLNMN